MRPVESRSHILPFPSRPKAKVSRPGLPEVGPLRRIELHQVEHDEIRALRDRLLRMILDNEQARKVARPRLVN